MKLSIVRLIGVLFLSAICNSATAQFKPPAEFGNLLRELKLGIAPLKQKYLIDNFYTTNETPPEKSVVSYNYQLSAHHKTLPLHFTVGLKPGQNVDIVHRVGRIATDIGMNAGYEVTHYGDDIKEFLLADDAGFLHAYLSTTPYFDYDYAFVNVYSSENGLAEIVVYYNKEGEEEEVSEEIRKTIDDVLLAFRFKEPIVENVNFAGIGVEFRLNSKYFEYQVLGVIKGGASDGNLLPGDFIIKVGNEFADEYDMTRIVNLIRGEINTDVEISIRRGSLYFSYKLTRKLMDMTVALEKITIEDINLNKIYFLLTTEFLLDAEIKEDDYGEFIESDGEVKKYKYYLDFPMKIPGTLIITNPEEDDRIEYTLFKSNDEEKVKKWYEELKGYMEGKYKAEYLYTTSVGENSISIIDSELMAEAIGANDLVYAKLWVEKGSGGTSAIKYVFYK